MSFLDPQFLITTLGLVGVWAIIFAESGLLIGFFLPGDSLLFTAGFLASAAAADFNIWLLAGGAAAAAILGDSLATARRRLSSPASCRLSGPSRRFWPASAE